MLVVKRVEGKNFTENDTGETLFERNPELHFHIKAPMYWWVDCDFRKYNLCMPTKNLEYCWDEWKESVPFVKNTIFILENAKLNPRQFMQALPLSTYLEGAVVLSYRDVVEVCENYQCGEYDYKELYNEWPMSREWADFCETLMDIRGVREIIEKEGMC